jgi:prepilin-type processing-associated H-X9-DG protein/prepilin-type N-terminal cleavage/methylation domain-containing protein
MMHEPNAGGREALHTSRGAFTLIEVLVVVGIIALLVSILLPSLSSARKDARAVVCAANLHHVGQAVAVYTNRYRVFPASYLYAWNNHPSGRKGTYQLDKQASSDRDFYIHWSYALYDEGKVDDKAFQCPEMTSGGHPRTNPGRNGSDWEGYPDDQGNTTPNGTEDYQAARMAYTANAAIMPRNKFTAAASGNGRRLNQFVNESSVKGTGRTILAAEFINSTRSITSRQDSNGLVVKSHRPITPFYNVASGWNEYGDSGGRAPFQYAATNSDPWGIQPYSPSLFSVEEMIDKNAPEGQKANCVGRHHPGGDKEFGGTANFLYCDGHVERKTVYDSIKKREWGDKFYSLTGTTDVLPFR